MGVRAITGKNAAAVLTENVQHVRVRVVCLLTVVLAVMFRMCCMGLFVLLSVLFSRSRHALACIFLKTVDSQNNPDATSFILLPDRGFVC